MGKVLTFQLKYDIVIMNLSVLNMEVFYRMKSSKIKVLSAILTAAFLFGAVACEGNVPEVVSETKVGFCANSQNVMREESFSGGDFVLNTFKGDVESGQIIINPKDDVERFNFKVNDLTREGGSEKLTSDMFDVFAERYIEVIQSTSGNTDTGWYPDALVPIKNYVAKRDNKIKKGENQGIWINLNVPKDAVPGKYVGAGELTLNDEKISVPMTVNVYNIDMPEENHVKTAFYLDTSSMTSGEGKSITEELFETYYEFALSKRISTLLLPGFTMAGNAYDPDEFAAASVKYAKDPRVAAYQLPYSGDGTGAVRGEYCEAVLFALAEKNVELIENGDTDVNLFKKAYFYLGSLIDEPSPERYDIVRECDLRIHKAKLKVADSDLLRDYPELRESVLKLNHIVTTKIVEQLYGTDETGGVQTWCPLINYFTGERNRSIALSRMNSTDRRGGEGVWWYTCCNPTNPLPTLHLDDTIMSPRLTSWMQYDYKIQGRIYWSMTAWFRFKENRVQSGFDVWKDALNYENCNGDGILLYPGSKYAVDGPIATLRLEALRESNEDYELLWLAERGIKAINERKGKNYDSDTILGKFYDRLYTGILRNEDLNSAKFESVRKELLSLVEKIYNDENAATALLDNYNK